MVRQSREAHLVLLGPGQRRDMAVLSGQALSLIPLSQSSTGVALFALEGLAVAQALTGTQLRHTQVEQPGRMVQLIRVAVAVAQHHLVPVPMEVGTQPMLPLEAPEVTL